MARFPAPWNWIEPVVDSKTGRATATFLAWLSQQLTANKLIEGAVPQDREINTTAPLTGGGNLSADLTLGFDGGLDDLNDVDLTTPPTDGQALVYDSGDSEWKPGTVAAGLDVQQEGVTIEDPATILNFTGTGVTVTTPSAGQVDIDISGGGVPVPFSGALVYKSGSQSVAHNTNTIISWDQEVYDTDNWHSTSVNTSRLTVPAGVSRVKLSGGAVISAASGGNVREFFITKNGSTFTGTANSRYPSLGASFSVFVLGDSAVVDVSPGDYFEFNVYQDSGGSLDVVSHAATWFAIEAVPEEYGGGSGGSSPYTPPVLADFPTSLNIGAETSASDTVEGMALVVGTGGAGTALRGYLGTYPGTPFSLIFKIKAGSTSQTSDGMGLLLRDSSGGRMLKFGTELVSGGGPILQRWNSSTSFQSTTAGGAGVIQDICYRFVDDGTDHIFYIGPTIEGPWFEFVNQSRTAWLPAIDQLGFGIEDQNATFYSLLVQHYVVS